jgi:hypothetical protein
MDCVARYLPSINQLAARKTLASKGKNHRLACAPRGLVTTRVKAMTYFQRLAAEAEAARQARLERLKAEAKAAEEAGALGLKSEAD